MSRTLYKSKAVVYKRSQGGVRCWLPVFVVLFNLLWITSVSEASFETNGLPSIRALKAPSMDSGASTAIPPRNPERRMVINWIGISERPGFVGLEMEWQFVDPHEEPLFDAPLETLPWKGYLKERGPLNMTIREETVSQPEALDESVWDLILGRESRKTSMQESMKTDEAAVVSMQNQMPTEKTETYSEPGMDYQSSSPDQPRSLLSHMDRLESIVDLQQRLLELLTLPNTIDPERVEEDNLDQLTFQLPGGLQPGAVRYGSQSRFEIRRD